ncbi:MAG: ATP-binding protein, partial [Pseudobdellovibrionaceae bacterium]|nr:ATP-binding protein [Pseudobdellovibrionaceae bacterium]
SIQFPLILMSPTRYQSEVLSAEIAQSLYYGALFAIGIYNFLLFVGTRLRVYGYYVLFLLGYFLFQATLGSQGYHFIWRDAIRFNEMMIFIGIAVTGLAATKFTAVLLDIDRKKPVSRYVLAYLGVSLVTTFTFYGVAGYTAAVKFMYIFTVVPWLAFLVYAGIVGTMRRERVSSWYLIAWSCFILGSLVTLLRQDGLIPSNGLTQSAQQIGSAIEFILLSFALADRIKYLQQRVEEEQAAALSANQFALEEERRLSELRDQMVANTSHELRTPLNGMMGLIQAVLRRDQDRLSPDSKRSLDNAVTCGKRMASLIGDLLDFSRGQRADIPLHRAPIDLREILSMVFDLLRPTLASKPVELQDFLPSPLPPLHADPDRLQQILFNLLGNAIKFTDQGQITVSALVEADHVIIRITDTGPGIPPDMQERIFEPFIQADGGTARHFGGTGLGLAVVKQLVLAHEGKVGVHSVLGYGSTFWFTLPISREQELAPVQMAPGLENKLVGLQSQMDHAKVRENFEPMTAVVASEPLAAGQVPRLDILVVDDEPVNLQVLIEILTLSGHSIRTALNGMDALRMLESGPVPDLVLLDVMMPGLSGFDVLQRIRGRFNEAELPVLIMTAKALERDLVQGFSLGATDYILKPFSASEVEARIAHQMRLQAAIWEGKAADKDRRILRHNMQLVENHLLHTERLASVGAMTGMVAHDLCSPLDHIHTVMGWILQRTQLLLQSPQLDPLCRPDVEHIQESAELAEHAVKTAEELANSLRMSIRTDQGPAELLRVDEVLPHVLRILDRKLKPLQVHLNVAAGVLILGRRSELVQLLMNLISNAADALEEKNAKDLGITIETVGKSIHILIEDGGSGIPDAIRDQIFEPFFTTKMSSKGTGLGLFVVKTISQRLQASIVVHTSEKYGGACFELNIPAA